MKKITLLIFLVLIGFVSAQELVSNFEIDEGSKIVQQNQTVLTKANITSSAEQEIEINLKYEILEKEKILYEEQSTISIRNNLIINKWLTSPEKDGNYKIKLTITNGEEIITLEDFFKVKKIKDESSFNLFYFILAFIVLSIIAGIIFGGYMIKKKNE